MRPNRILRAMRPVAIVLAFTLIANLVSCDGRAMIELAGPVGLDPAGGLRGLLAVVRIVLLVGFSLVVAASTTGTQLSDACVRLLRPCARWGVPVGPLGTVLSLALYSAGERGAQPYPSCAAGTWGIVRQRHRYRTDRRVGIGAHSAHDRSVPPCRPSGRGDVGAVLRCGLGGTSTRASPARLLGSSSARRGDRACDRVVRSGCVRATLVG